MVYSRQSPHSVDDQENNPTIGEHNATHIFIKGDLGRMGLYVHVHDKYLLYGRHLREIIQVEACLVQSSRLLRFTLRSLQLVKDLSAIYA